MKNPTLTFGWWIIFHLNINTLCFFMYAAYVWLFDLVQKPEIHLWGVVGIEAVIAVCALVCAQEEVKRQEVKNA